jgi:hypothetical protein
VDAPLPLTCIGYHRYGLRRLVAGQRTGIWFFLYSDRRETEPYPVPFIQNGSFGSFMGTEDSRLEAQLVSNLQPACNQAPVGFSNAQHTERSSGSFMGMSFYRLEDR